MNESQFIENLSKELVPKRYWSPWLRASVWTFWALLLNSAAMLAVQSFRPGFFQQLIDHPRFLLEIASASLLTLFFIFFVFADLVPGRKISWPFKIFSLVSFFAFAGSLYLSFETPSPKTSFIGARSYCLEEVVVYGFIGLITFCFFAFKSPYPLSRRGYFSMGLAATIIPGTLMQLACMYSPKHSLIVHYGPVLAMGILAILSLSFFKNRG